MLTILTAEPRYFRDDFESEFESWAIQPRNTTWKLFVNVVVYVCNFSNYTLPYKKYVFTNFVFQIRRKNLTLILIAW
jgi:hypothetical protein